MIDAIQLLFAGIGLAVFAFFTFALAAYGVWKYKVRKAQRRALRRHG